MPNPTPTNKKVTQLPVATTVAPTDVLLVVQGGVTKQVSHSTVAEAVAGSTQLAAAYLKLPQRSTDGTGGFPAPTGVGLELVFSAAGLDDIRLNGVSQ